MITKFYANENFPLNFVKELRRLGYDVLTSAEAGQANQSISDESVLKFACQHERVVITLNHEDFITLHKQGKKHSGIIICKEDREFQKQAQVVHEFILNNTSLKERLIRIKKQNQKGASQLFVAQEY
ncbi:DUF5615 family PIN-like protein [Gloeocapsopsis dulcis]|uniref:DUF5615 family PIN-like protein n=1 Tax=Gloeocapsopsis dulcis TaxID=2859516 RepID=UPI001F1E195D|nr:DUF5615 family PIN-like protein [Gloeocapsopsis dulcis]WNN87550.1 DUF5615 family PIN-like protein [Gloeocapsopsis dulcis]